MKKAFQALISLLLSVALLAAAPGSGCCEAFAQAGNARANSGPRASSTPPLASPALSAPVDAQAPLYNLSAILAAPGVSNDLALPLALEPAADVRAQPTTDSYEASPFLPRAEQAVRATMSGPRAAVEAPRPRALLGNILGKMNRLWRQTPMNMDSQANVSGRIFDNRRPLLAWTMAAATVIGGAWQAVAGDKKSPHGVLAPATLSATLASARPKGNGDPAPARLYDTIRPKSYDLKIALDPEKEGFTGEVEISADVVRKTKTLTLHSLELDIKEAYVNGRKIAASDIRLDAASETVSLALGAEFSGPATIKIKYSGKLNQQMKGLYQSRAKYQGREERYAFTQLEATDARRMFIGVDEPEAKAEFQLTVTAPEHLAVLSNMPAQNESRHDGFKTVSFQKTPRMSSYLLALAVARLESKSIMVGKTAVTAWAMPQDMDKVDFALETAKQALTYLNDYMGLPYQLPELKLVAVPDFAMGAMENWGSIFFRDSAILLDPKLSSARARRRVAEVVIHEIVHQWFGNLVTMEWWDDLWLNEAFATWLSYKIMDGWHPEWNIWREFAEGAESALQVDALRNTRPVKAEVHSAAEIEAMFDKLTYEKGGALLRMIENFLGEKKFRDGIRRYMRAHKFGNTKAADLWDALEESSGQPVGRMAGGWLEQPGFPIVEVASLSKDNHTLRLAQRPFDAHGRGDSTRRWAIPVVIRYKLRGDKRIYSHRMLLEKDQVMIRLPGKGAVEWAYPNEDEAGYYRVALDEKLGKALRGALKSKHSGFGALERMGILNDAWARAENGEIAVDALLESIVDLKDDKTRAVLELRGELLRSMADFLAGSPRDHGALARLAEELFEQHWNRLGWEPGPKEDDERKLARASVLSTLGALAPSEKLKQQVQERVDRYLKDPSSIDPALVGPVLRLGARLGGDSRLFERYWEGFRRATNPEQRVQYLEALASFRQAELIRRILKMTLDEKDIRGQDMWKPIAAALKDPDLQEEAWRFIRENWPAIRAKTGTTGADRIIQNLSLLWRRDLLAEAKDFFAKSENQVEAADRSLRQSLEEMELGIRFKDAQSRRLSDWLKARYPNPPLSDGPR